MHHDLDAQRGLLLGRRVLEIGVGRERHEGHDEAGRVERRHLGVEQDVGQQHQHDDLEVADDGRVVRARELDDQQTREHHQEHADTARQHGRQMESQQRRVGCVHVDAEVVELHQQERRHDREQCR